MVKIFPHNFPVHAESVQNTPGKRPKGKGGLPWNNIHRGVDAAQGGVFEVMAECRLVDCRYLFCYRRKISSTVNLCKSLRNSGENTALYTRTGLVKANSEFCRQFVGALRVYFAGGKLCAYFFNCC
jgi:hypothetical protein